MKKILFLSPVPLDNEPSGISIRINELKSRLEDIGVSGKIADRYNGEAADYLYLMVSTKEDSVAFKVASRGGKIPLIVDLYTPVFLEKDLSFNIFSPYDWLVRFQKKQVVKKIIQRGDHFFVANRRQKDYWLKTARELKIKIKRNDISVIPTGAPKFNVRKLPFPQRHVILWFGGMYPWMNPSLLIEAFSKIAYKYPTWELRILGGFHPKTGYQALYQKIIQEAKAAIPASQLEIENWQNLDKLPKFLNDVALAVHLSKQTKEDYYAHRVRLLTLLNAGIPVLTNGKDTISDLVAANKAGELLKGSDVIAKKLQSLVNNPIKIEQLSKNAPQIQEIFLSGETDEMILEFLL